MTPGRSTVCTVTQDREFDECLTTHSVRIQYVIS